MPGDPDNTSRPEQPSAHPGNPPAPPSADQHPPDATLVRRAIAGDESAARTLIERYDRLVRYTVFRTGRRFCERDPAWLDARANEAWAGVFRSLQRAGARALPPNLPAYISQITKNKCLDAAHEADDAQNISFEQAAEGGIADEHVDSAPGPLQILEDLEQVEALRDCLSRLSEEDRLLCAEIGLIADRQWAAAAAQLGMPESTLRSRWNRVVTRLKQCLEKKIQKKLAPPGNSTDS